MLIEFRVSNFKSIKEEVTLSMAASSDQSHPDNVIAGLVGDERLLRSSAIYGPNASGKSNVIAALAVMQFLVVNSHIFQKGAKLPYFPFKFSDEYVRMPTSFEVDFIEGGTEYSYGLKYNASQITEEHLYYYPKGRKATIFQRQGNKFIFKTDGAKQTPLKEMTLDNVLYVSRATQMNYGKTAPVIRWFTERLRVIESMEFMRTLDERCTVDMIRRSKKTRDAIISAMAASDVGIVDIEARTDVNDICMKHRVTGLDGRSSIIEISLAEESEGTKRLFDLIGYWVDALENGKLIVFDDIEVKFHHLLSVFLIGMFHDMELNPKGSQLIITSHDVKLLDQELFRRDQIWFTEKDPNAGFTRLYSLSEFSERKDRDIEKGYMTGRYGALPFIQGRSV